MAIDANCLGCQGKINSIDYKQADVLRKFVSGTFKVTPSRRSKLCNKHQRRMTLAIKRARFMALLPYTRNQVHKR